MPDIFHTDVLDIFTSGVIGFLSGVGTGFLIWGRKRMMSNDHGPR